MKRRALFKTVAAALAVRPWSALASVETRPGVEPQTPAGPPPDFSDADVVTLNAVGEVVLPESIGEEARRAVVADFVAWVRNYREGADRGHSYGDSSIAAPTPPSPARRYPEQLRALTEAARVSGSATFAALPIAVRRALLVATFENPAIRQLPARPNGVNLIADLMGFYFTSGDAYDLCYEREIGRDRCRTLDGSEREPAPRGR